MGLSVIWIFVFIQIRAHAQDEPRLTYRRTTAEVRLSFLATDDQTRTAASLQQSDFVVIDSGEVVRDFRSFSRAAEANLQLLILLDCSESVSSQMKSELQEALRLLTEIRGIPGSDVSLVSFAGTQPQLVCAGNCRGQIFDDPRLHISPAGTTPLFDAVVFATAFLAQHRAPDVRPVLVIFSDGLDTISRHSETEAIENALKAETQIYSVDISGAKTRQQRGVEALKRMSNVTGGKYFGASDGAAKILVSVLEDLRSGYVVTYSVPIRRTGFHEVRILPTHNLNLEFRSRRGYYYAGNSAE